MLCKACSRSFPAVDGTPVEASYEINVSDPYAELPYVFVTYQIFDEQKLNVEFSAYCGSSCMKLGGQNDVDHMYRYARKVDFFKFDDRTVYNDADATSPTHEQICKMFGLT